MGQPIPSKLCFWPHPDIRTDQPAQLRPTAPWFCPKVDPEFSAWKETTYAHIKRFIIWDPTRIDLFCKTLRFFIFFKLFSSSFYFFAHHQPHPQRGWGICGSVSEPEFSKKSWLMGMQGHSVLILVPGFWMCLPSPRARYDQILAS